MKRVLIITYYWPPSGGGGVQRWLKFVKYLRRYGWEPVVYAPEDPEYPEFDHSLVKEVPDGLEIIKRPIWEPFDLYKKFTGRKREERLGAGFLSERKNGSRLHNFAQWARGNFFIPDARKFWIRPSVNYLKKYLRHHPVDAVVTTGPPMSMHMIGLKLKKITGIRWLADFRDPWTNVDFYHELNLMKWADRKHHRYERTVLEAADEVTVVSNGMVTDFKKIVNRTYHVITNGFDEEDFKTEDVPLDSKFSIGHFGSLGKARNPELLWEVLSQVKSEIQDFDRDLEIKLVGNVDFQVMESIQKHGLTENLNRIGYLSHDEMIQEMKRSQVLLLVINNTPNAKLIATGKLFEYLAARRPILCIGPEDGDAARIIGKTGAGEVCGFDDQEKLKRSIRICYLNFSNKGLVIKGKGIENYARRLLAGEIAKCLNDEQ
ncbi:MAG: glycosyltransferase family 4 protein [Bacteroidetes bacterium]|nr:glycosyltransferase family 4 protein [Bacteroidota bacterium]